MLIPGRVVGKWRMRLSYRSNISFCVWTLSGRTAHADSIDKSVGRAANVSAINRVTAELCCMNTILVEVQWRIWLCRGSIDRVWAEFLRYDVSIPEMILYVILIITWRNESVSLTTLVRWLSVVRICSKLTGGIRTRNFIQYLLALCRTQVLFEAT